MCLDDNLRQAVATEKPLPERLAALGWTLRLCSGPGSRGGRPNRRIDCTLLDQSLTAEEFVCHVFHVAVLTVESVVQLLHLLIGNLAA